MKTHYRDLIKSLNQHIVKYQIFSNKKRIFANAAEKVQSNVSSMQDITTEKYNTIAKKFNDQITIVQDLREKALVQSTPLPKRIVKWWQWYNQLTGLDTVEKARKQVNTFQDKLFECQDKRRSSNRELTNATEKLNDIMVELAQTKRDDYKYIYLTKMEHEHALQQKRIFNDLILLDKEEKDTFTRLTTATKEYHDSQTLHSQKYKYLSIIASAVIAIASLIGSMIFNSRRVYDVRVTLEKNQVSDLARKMSNTIVQQLPAAKEKRNENTSNMLVASAKYSVNLLISGSSYIYRGVYACGSYVGKFFYK